MNKLIALIMLAALPLAATMPRLEITDEAGRKIMAEAPLTERKVEFKDGSLTCRVEPADRNQLREWKVTFSTLDPKPRLLKLRLTAPLDFKCEGFWDGNAERKITALPVRRKSLLEAFPLAAAWDQKQGKALGGSPDTILSVLERGLDAQGIVLETRIVADNRKDQSVTFIEFDFVPEFSWRNAVDRYYAAYPQYFTPAPGVDQRIYGVGGYLTGAHRQRLFQLHSARGSGLEWDWTYAPWFEEGSWYAVGENWKNEKNLFPNYHALRKPEMLTRQEYDDALKTQMSIGNRTCAMFFYILVKDIYQDAADKHPDAVEGPSGLNSIADHAGKTKSVFAPGSPIFDDLKKQIRKIVENYEISGFAFDMTNSSYHFHTPSQLEYAVGRAWDDKGKIYTSDTVAPIPFADEIHTLKRGDKTIATIFNAALSNFSPFTFFHADGAIMEGTPEDNISMLLPLRLTMGRKPLSFFSPVEKTGNTGILWRKVQTREERLAVWQGLAQLQLLKCYELGISPMSRSTSFAGGKFFMPHLEAIKAMKLAGYQVVPAIKGAGKLWTGRFGTGAGTILTFGNPTRETVSAEVEVVNSYLGKGRYGFLFPAGTLEQRFKDGRTCFRVTLEPKAVLALRAVELSGNPETFTAAEEGGKLTLSADRDFSFRCRQDDFQSRKMQADDVKSDGGFITGTSQNKVATLTLAPRCSVLAAENALTAFLAPGETPSVVYAPGPESENAAWMTAMYRPHVAASLKFCGEINNREPGFMDGDMAVPDLPMVKAGNSVAGKKIYIGTRSDFPQLRVPGAGPFLAMPDPDTLWIGGDTPEEVSFAALRYFELLDAGNRNTVRVNFKQPVGWSIGGEAQGVTFVPGDGQKYLRIAGDPDNANNPWRYGWFEVKGVSPGDEISFTFSCKAEKITAGRFEVGVYQFADGGRKSLGFTPVEVKAAPGWVEYSGRIKLNKECSIARIYFLARNLGKGDEILIRSLNINHNTQKR